MQKLRQYHIWNDWRCFWCQNLNWHKGQGNSHCSDLHWTRSTPRTHEHLHWKRLCQSEGIPEWTSGGVRRSCQHPHQCATIVWGFRWSCDRSGRRSGFWRVRRPPVTLWALSTGHTDAALVPYTTFVPETPSWNPTSTEAISLLWILFRLFWRLMRTAFLWILMRMLCGQFQWLNMKLPRPVGHSDNWHKVTGFSLVTCHTTFVTTQNHD